MFEAIVNGRSVWAILDNGAGNTIIDTGLARELNLQVESATGTIRTTHSQTEKSTVNGVRLEVPGQFKIAGNFVGADLAAISEVAGKEVGLILGSDILSNLSYLVDAKNKRMIFVLAGGMNPRSPSVTVIHLSNGVLEGTLNGSPARFQVDLGSNSPLLVLRDSWKKYFEMSDTTTVSRSIDLSGTIVERVVVEDVAVSFSGIDATLDARQISSSRDGVDGFLGFPVFHDRVVIFDYRNDRIFILD
ncbi:MAG: retropepsin-like domain-containing protein [Erythrobacter sp.]|nr:retropepsin-like domain-containing protein [Erythrobacter sp.]